MADLNCEGCMYNGPECNGDCKTGQFKVKVSGVTMYETSNVLIANAMAHSYRGIGWLNVSVTEEV